MKGVSKMGFERQSKILTLTSKTQTIRYQWFITGNWLSVAEAENKMTGTINVRTSTQQPN
jgi:hypothetical protein